MAKVDLILLHAPSVYDFRERPMLAGPVSDVVPSTQVFEMYPIGFLTILTYLQSRGYSVRIINIALRMLQSGRFDAERLIRSLNPLAFGIDLHWMVHVQGSLALAGIVKKCHPNTPVIFGGLSASYYHEELIRRDPVDYVVRGDSTEEPLRMLLDALRNGRKPEDVPNLSWKDGGTVRINELSHVPSATDALSFDYRQIMRSCARHFDILGHIPFRTWLKYPIVAVNTCRGCVNGCVICGGSASAYRRTSARTAPVYHPPELLARDIGVVSRYLNAPVMVLGDITQAGERYAGDFLAALKRENIRNHVAFEFFSPPDRRTLERIADAVPNFNAQISPESHDERVRRAFGRRYGNESLERGIADMLAVGCRRVDVFFMIGLPEQTPESVMDTVGYCDRLIGGARGRHAGKIHPYIAPLAPFLDPGSEAFENPERHGYRLFCRTLEEHRKALLGPSWKHALNYETKWMNRDQIAETTYEAALRLNEVKCRHDLVGRREAERIAARIARERALMAEIDAVLSEAGGQSSDAAMGGLMRRFDAIGPSSICRKDEMRWPTPFVRFNPVRILKEALAGFLHSAYRAPAEAEKQTKK